MINLKYLAMYRNPYMIHTRRHIAFLIVFAYTFISLFAQEMGGESIAINTQEVQVPAQTGIRVMLKGQDWTYARVNMSMGVISTPLYLVSVEDTETHTIFLFYRQTVGVEILHFTRYDNEMGVLYSYDLRAEWKDGVAQPNALVYADDFIRVMLVPPLQADDAQAASAQDTQLAPAQTMQPAPARSTLSAAPDVPEIEEPAPAQDTQAAPAQTTQPAPARSTLSAAPDVPEIEEPAPAAGMENAAEESDMSTSDAASEQAISKEEMMAFISTQITTMPFEALQQAVEEWSTTGAPNMVDIGNVLWHFAQKLHENVSTLEDITNLLTLYDTITEQYPLSREYFLAIQKARQIRQHYIFVLE